MYKVENRWDHKNSIHVEWNIGKRCNLDCTYCPAEIHDNFSKHTDIKTMISTIDILAELERPVRLSFTGGEPCVHPRIIDIIDHAAQKLNWINITTNGTLSHKLYARLPVNHYVFSLHVEDDNNWERCVNNILYFSKLNEAERKIPFQINLMAHYRFMDRVKQCAKIFGNHQIPYVVRRIRWTEKHDWFDDLKYSSEDLQWILDRKSTVKPNCIIDDNELVHANDIIKEHRNQFQGWNCAAGLESLMINWNGEVYRATCRVGGSLGNIYNGSFEIPQETIVCTRKWCTCAADIPITKVST